MTRYIGLPKQPEGRGPAGRRFCRGVHGGELVEVPKGCRAWCSGECETDALIRGGYGNIIRHAVSERDQGVCALCLSDPVLAARVMCRLKLSCVRPRWGEAPHHSGRQAPNPPLELLRRLWGLSGSAVHLWEADHILPVIEGGGGCGLDGYRTLCRPCHNAETRKLRRRLSRARSPQRRLPIEAEP